MKKVYLRYIVHGLEKRQDVSKIGCRYHNGFSALECSHFFAYKKTATFLRCIMTFFVKITYLLFLLLETSILYLSHNNRIFFSKFPSRSFSLRIRESNSSKIQKSRNFNKEIYLCLSIPFL